MSSLSVPYYVALDHLPLSVPLFPLGREELIARGQSLVWEETHKQQSSLPSLARNQENRVIQAMLPWFQ